MIINTRNAVLDMTIYTYPVCTNRTGLTLSQNSIYSIQIILSPGLVYNKHIGGTKCRLRFK